METACLRTLLEDVWEILGRVTGGIKEEPPCSVGSPAWIVTLDVVACAGFGEGNFSSFICGHCASVIFTGLATDDDKVSPRPLVIESIGESGEESDVPAPGLE